MMTKAQRDYFFGVLWPKACRAQGWRGVTAMELKRRAVVLAATTALKHEVPGARLPTERMSLCDQDQLTAVFNAVKLLGDPQSLGKARAVANPAEAHDADERRRLVWKIRECGFADAYVQEIAAWDCREAQVASWDRLPVESLKRVLIHVNRRRLDKGQPLSDGAASRDYTLRPSRPFVPKPQPVTVEEPF